MASDYSEHANVRITAQDKELVQLIAAFWRHLGLHHRRSNLNPAIEANESAVLREAISLGLRELLIREGSRGRTGARGDYHERRMFWQNAAAQEGLAVIQATVGQPHLPQDAAYFEQALTMLLRDPDTER